MTQPISIMIVDDHPMVRDGLKVFLSVFDDLRVIGEAGSGAEALRLYQQLEPDIIIMDMVMPEMDGPTTIDQIQKNGWPVQVIALTSFDDQDMVQSAMEAGAAGYLHKDVRAAKLAQAIRAAAQGRGTLDDVATQALIQASRRPAVGQDLTPREQEVLRLLVQGKMNKEIGQELVISPATVRLHVSNILGKLNVTNRTEAVSVAFQHKLV